MSHRIWGIALVASLSFAGERGTVLIKLKDRFDLSKFESARGASVASTLQSFTENAIRKELPGLVVNPSRGIDAVEPLWIAGVVKVTGDLAAIQRNLPWSRGSEIEIEKAKAVELRIAPTVTPVSRLTEMGWGVAKTGALDSWQQGARGQGVTVAVLDSGVAVSHPDLAGNIWTNPGESGKDANGSDRATNGLDDDQNGFIDDIHGWNFEENSSDLSDQQGHGTQAAGIVAGNGHSGIQTGVAPAAKIMVLKACCMLGGEVAESAMWSALQYAIQNGARVISMSVTMRPFGNPSWAGWRRVGEVLNAAGVVHVNSAGNRGEGNAPFNIGAPATNPPAWLHPEQKQGGSLSSMITVGAVDANDQPRSYSSAGPVSWEHVEEYKDFLYDGGSKPGLVKPEICGPSEVPSLAKDGKSYTASFGGTSSATPHVAGAVANLLSLKPGLTVAQVTQALQLSAASVGGSFGNRCGAGRVDLSRTIQYAKKNL